MKSASAPTKIALAAGSEEMSGATESRQVGLAGQAILIAQLEIRLGGTFRNTGPQRQTDLDRCALTLSPEAGRAKRVPRCTRSTGETLAKYFGDVRSRADESQACREGQRGAPTRDEAGAGLGL